ncbi:MAG TPA: isoprenylcysteine carboxylmethyltransferase family protein [Gaiellaceae bacterium]
MIVAAAWLPPATPRWLKLVGVLVAAAGAVFVVWAGRTLGKNLTPFPQPRAGGELVEHGPFRYARHPIYGGGILFFVGLALATSFAALVPTALLALLWIGKSRNEELRLAERFPGYPEYRDRVRGRFLPGL